MRSGLLVLLVLACLDAPVFQPNGGERALHLAVVIDVSHSMSVPVDNGTALDAAVAVAENALDRLAELEPTMDRCAVLWTVDATIRYIGAIEAGGIRRHGLHPQPRGGNPMLLGQAAQAARETSSRCSPTHSLVVTDRPAPADLDLELGRRTVWIDVTRPMANVGIAKVKGLASGLSDTDFPVVEIAQFGDPPDHLSLAVGSGATRRNISIDVSAPGPWHIPLILEPGPVEITLSPGGAYQGDDRVLFEYSRVPTVRVDWRLPGIKMPSVPGWIQLAESAPERPDLRVLPLAEYQVSEKLDYPKEPPTVLVYRGLEQGTSGASIPPKIGLFIEETALLDAVNFDVLERALGRAIVQLPKGFMPVIANDAGKPVMAIRNNPPAAIVPMLQSGEDPQLERLSLTTFFNSVRWVNSRSRRSVPIRHLDPNGQEIRNAVLESDTAEPAKLAGAVESIRPVRATNARVPLWPWLIVFALAILALERAVGVFWRGRPA